MPICTVRARIDQLLLDGVEEHRAVRIALAEIVGPGVDMRVDVHQRERTSALFGGGPQQRQCDGVIAAQRDEVCDRRGLFLDERQALRDVAERNPEIADVGHRKRGGVDPALRVIAVHQHAARLPDRSRPETRAAAVGGAQIERDAGNAERRVGGAARDREKAWLQGEGWNGCHCYAAVKRKTAAATAQVQRPFGSPSAAAVMDVLPMMRLLV